MITGCISSKNMLSPRWSLRNVASWDKLNLRLVLFLVFFSDTVLGDAFKDRHVPKPHLVKLIEEANYCKVKSDCNNIGPIGPYGCYILINKENVNEVKPKIEAARTLLYSCLRQRYDCLNGKCSTTGICMGLSLVWCPK